jgi:hypothetical protein
MAGVPHRQQHKVRRLHGLIPPLDKSASVTWPALCCYFFWLAHQQGFAVPTIARLEPRAAPLPTLQAREDMESTNQDEPVHGRCGIPFINTMDEDRLALAQDRLGKPWNA